MTNYSNDFLSHSSIMVDQHFVWIKYYEKALIKNKAIQTRLIQLL